MKLVLSRTKEQDRQAAERHEWNDVNETGKYGTSTQEEKEGTKCK
jgi:hypothetical protein